MKFILLNPLQPADFRITYDEMLEAVKEFGCGLIMSHNIAGESVWFITAPTKEALGNLCTSVDIPGTAVEYTAVYEQYVTLEK